MDFLSLIMPFYIESIFCFLIILFIYHYLFSVNPKLHNDNFSLTNLALFFLMSIIIILYLLIKDPEIFYYSSRLVSLDLNNLLIKLFLLIQFSFLCFF